MFADEPLLTLVQWMVFVMTCSREGTKCVWEMKRMQGRCLDACCHDPWGCDDMDVTNKLTVSNLRQTLPRTLEPSIEFFIYVD
jgi:hypothetical protein